MGRCGSCFVWRTKRNLGLATNNARLVFCLFRGSNGKCNCFRVMAIDSINHMPAICLESFCGIVSKPSIAEKVLAARFNQTDDAGNAYAIVDHYTYVFVGDGCLMEGISHEVSSLAGTLQLGKLICIYDDNGISIDGKVDGWFTDDTAKRFEAYGWHSHGCTRMTGFRFLDRVHSKRTNGICPDLSRRLM